MHPISSSIQIEFTTAFQANDSDLSLDSTNHLILILSTLYLQLLYGQAHLFIYLPTQVSSFITCFPPRHLCQLQPTLLINAPSQKILLRSAVLLNIFSVSHTLIYVHVKAHLLVSKQQSCFQGSFHICVQCPKRAPHLILSRLK